MSLISNNKVDNNKYELEVKIDADKFEEAIEKTYKKNVKKINVQGFRQGKAPRKMVEKMYGEGVFFEDAVNDLYPEAVDSAVKETDLVLVARPEVEITDVSKENGITMKVTCITKPEVKISGYKGIKAEKTVKDVTDEDVNAKLDELREQNGRLVTVEGRAAELDDNAIIDFEGFVDGVPFEGGKGDNFDLGLGSGQFIPGFEDQILGHNVGDEFDVNVTFPEDYQSEELKGKDSVFKVKLHELKVKELPEADDEFAKDISEVDTIADLKADIKKDLETAAAKLADDEVENQMIDALIEKLEADIPAEMIQSRVDESVREYEYRLQSQGLDLQTYLQYSGMTLEDFRKGFEEQSDKQVKVRLALEEIVKLEKIEPSDEDMTNEYAKLAEMYKMEVEKIKELIPEKDLKLDVCVNKAIDFLKENATITEKK